MFLQLRHASSAGVERRWTINTYKNQRSALSESTIIAFRIKRITPTLTLARESSNTARQAPISRHSQTKGGLFDTFAMFISAQPRVVRGLATVWGRTARASWRERSSSSRSYSVAPRRPTVHALAAATLEHRTRPYSTPSKTASSQLADLTNEIIFKGSEFAPLKDNVIIVTGKSNIRCTIKQNHKRSTKTQVVPPA